MIQNVILVLIDSLNRHHLRVYDPAARAEIPNLERFAGRAHRFDNHFVGSLPCMPARREIFAGRREMMWRPWGPLEPFDVRLPRLVAATGRTAAIVTDHYHYWEEEANGYLQAFDAAELIRGHENDLYRPPLRSDAELPGWIERIEKYRPGKGRGYYANVADFADERDYFPAKVFSSARDWIARYAQDAPFFLQVESFDVHEPFDVPEPYASLYTDGSRKNEFNVWPPYQDVTALERFMAETSDEELDFLRAQYDAKLTMVDRWFGELVDALDSEDLWEETMVVVTTDHGHDLGERGVFGKQWPHFDSHANIPLLVWHPHYPAKEPVTSISSTVDLHATVLDAVGTKPPSTPGHSRSLIPLLAGNDGQRDATIYGTFGQGVVITDGEWSLFKSPTGTGSLNSYSSMIFRSLTADHVRSPTGQGHFIPAVELPQWKIPIELEPLDLEDRLYHRVEDPWMRNNLWHDASDQRRRMLRRLAAILEEEGAPPEQFTRLGVTPSSGDAG